MMITLKSARVRRSHWSVMVLGGVAAVFADEAAAQVAPVIANPTPVVQAAWQHHSNGLITTGRYSGLGQWMFTIRGNTTLVAVELNQLVRVPNYANSLTVGGRPERIVLGTNGGTVELRDAMTLGLQKTFRIGPEYSIYAVAIDPAGKQIASCRTDGTVLVWNVDRENPLYHLQKASREGERMAALAFSPDGKSLATLSRYGYLALWNLADGTRIGEPVDKVGGENSDLRFTPEGDRIVVVDRSQIRFWHPQHEPTPRLIVAPEAVCPKHPERNDLIPRSGPDFGNGIRFAGPASLSPDAKRIASILENGGVGIWDITTLKIVKTLPPPKMTANYEHLGSVFQQIAFAPNAKKIAAVANTGELVVWDAE